jgi:hypothetical protein
MKKKTLLLASALFAGTTFAQDLTSKKGETILPEAGDWAISFDAVPFLNYFGQMLSNAGASSPAVGYTNGYPWAIKGKMFKDEKTAYRGGLRLGFGSNTWRNEVVQAQAGTFVPPAYPSEPARVEDTWKRSYNSIVLSGGMEMRRGKTRLQGYYGGEVLIGFGGWKDAFEYGNTLFSGAIAASSVFVDGSSAYATDWTTAGVNNFTTDYNGNDARYTEMKVSSMTIGLRGFIGVEYFIFPKISIGAEYGWGLGLSSTKVSTAFEANDDSATAGTFVLGSFTTENKTNGFAIDSDIQNSATGISGGSGSLNIIFHF